MQAKLMALRAMAERNVKKLAAASVAMAATASQAAVDPTVTAKITEFGNDGSAYASAIMLACFTIWAVKKLARKMGWF